MRALTCRPLRVCIGRAATPAASAAPSGVFLVYEFSPFMVMTSTHAQPFTRFLTNVCAIVGGAFTVRALVRFVLARLLSPAHSRSRPPPPQLVGMVDSLVYHMRKRSV